MSEKIFAPDKPTMNLDPEEINLFTLQNKPDRFRQIVLHEFGHAIGCIHEHQQPNAHINSNRDYLYTKLAEKPNKWDKDKVDFNTVFFLALHILLPDLLQLSKTSHHLCCSGSSSLTRHRRHL